MIFMYENNNMKTLYLTNELREKLKKPFGISIFGKKKEVCEKFKQFQRKKKFKKIVTVGDYCSLALLSDVKIFDGKIKRRKIKKILPFSLKCSNPKGTIQKECWQIIKKALKENKNIFVGGEEDLLAIPVVLLAEKNTAVVYGLPNKGICLVKVSPKTKKKFKELLKKFRNARR